MNKSAEFTIDVTATRWQDHDNVLEAAADEVRETLGADLVPDYDLSPRWEDEDTREGVVVTIPVALLHKIDPDAQCPDHGCSRWRCAGEH